MSDQFSYWIGDCVYTPLHEFDTLCSNNPVQLCSASAGGTIKDPVQCVPFCFTCKHHNPIRNAPKSRLDNRLASMQTRLIDFLANRQKDTKYARRNEIILERNSVPELFSRLRVNTNTPECFSYRIQESVPLKK